MPAVQITKVTIKDSIIHKSSLLFGDAGGTVTTDYRIEDSIVHKSKIAEGDEELGPLDESVTKRRVVKKRVKHR